MEIVESYKSVSGSVRFTDTVYPDEPDVRSRAALILLNRYLREIDSDEIKKRSRLQDYLDERYRFMEDVLAKDGMLRCHYCGRKGLEIGFREAEKAYLNNTNPKLATIDHKVPMSSGRVDKLDTKNWVISCRACNSRKGSMNYQLFKAMMQREIDARKNTHRKKKKGGTPEHKKKSKNDV